MQLSDALVDDIYQTLTKLAGIPQLIGRMQVEAGQWQAMQQAVQQRQQAAETPPSIPPETETP